MGDTPLPSEVPNSFIFIIASYIYLNYASTTYILYNPGQKISSRIREGVVQLCVSEEVGLLSHERQSWEAMNFAFSGIQWCTEVSIKLGCV
jgi:hypothetical protein